MTFPIKNGKNKKKIIRESRKEDAKKKILVTGGAGFIGTTQLLS